MRLALHRSCCLCPFSSLPMQWHALPKLHLSPLCFLPVPKIARSPLPFGHSPEALDFPCATNAKLSPRLTVHSLVANSTSVQKHTQTRRNGGRKAHTSSKATKQDAGTDEKNRFDILLCRDMKQKYAVLKPIILKLTTPCQLALTAAKMYIQWDNRVLL